MTSFFLIDDDDAARRMLSMIIEDSDLGAIVGEAADGLHVESLVCRVKPEVLLIDLLMPGQDGITTIQRTRKMGYRGKIVMISQVETKDLISEAYQHGVEYYIQKPINKLEVVSILKKVIEKIKLEQSIMQISESINWISGDMPQPSAESDLSIGDIVRSYLSNLGVVGEVGSRDLVKIVEYLVDRGKEYDEDRFPALKDIYTSLLQDRSKSDQAEREIRAIEQRVRRTVAQALRNVASLGLTDYANPTFELYANKYFDFSEIRQKMREIDKEEDQTRVRLNIKKFIFTLYLDVLQDIKGKYRRN